MKTPTKKDTFRHLNIQEKDLMKSFGSEDNNLASTFWSMLRGGQGEAGKTPVKGKDYFTLKEIEAIINGAKPVKGEDYFTKEEIVDFLKTVTPVKGKHYYTVEDVKDLIEKVSKITIEKSTPIKGKHYRDGVDGYTPKKGVDYFDGKHGNEITPQEIVEKINSLEEKIEPTTIRGLGKAFEKIETRFSVQAQRSRNDVHGPGRLAVFSAGTRLTDNFTELNFTGAGVTTTYANNGRVTATITSGGGGLTILPATGAINDSNLAFTFTVLPTVLVINGGVYQQTGGAITWTWVGGTLTATLSQVVGVNGSIFGL